MLKLCATYLRLCAYTGQRGVVLQTDVERLRPDWWNLIIDEFFVSQISTLKYGKFFTPVVCLYNICIE